MAYPDIFSKLYFGNTVLQLATFLGIIAVSIIVGKILYYFTKGAMRKLVKKTKSTFDDIFIDIIEEPLVLLVVIVGFYFGYSQLTLSETAVATFQGLTRTFTTIAVAWFLIRVVDAAIEHVLMPATKKTESDLDDHLVPIIKRLSKIIIISITFIMILSNLGYDVTSVLAGLGIGGLAFALAAQDLLKNLFGGITIITDKPFKMGQWVDIGGYQGEVVEIGLRSTRLKTGNGEFITIPNSHIAEKGTINYKKYRQRMITFTLGLACDTSNAKMEKAKKEILDIIRTEKLLKKDSEGVFFTNFGESTYDLEVRYIVSTNDAGEVRIIKDRVNTKIKEMLESIKVELAYPTQTIFLKK